MSDCITCAPSQKLLDPFRRVKYSLGLVMGVDEFDQEQRYLIERNRLHNRALHGYGTVCGLDVSVRDTPNGPEVVVSAGLAVNPQGQEIRVPAAQCGRLNAWLARNQDAVLASLGSPLPTFPPGPLDLYVVLCYRECETDSVPVPGEPCRSQADSMVASRIADDFELALWLQPPPQVEEDVVRAFGRLLARLEISATAGSYVTQADLEQLVRDLATVPSLPDEPPPVPETPLFIQPDQAHGMLQAAFTIWVTEVRPQLVGADGDCAAGPVDGDCVLLARLRFDVTPLWEVNGPAANVQVDESDRPILLHTRLLQEWMLCGLAGQGSMPKTFASLFAHDAGTLRAWIHHPELLNIHPDSILVSINDAPPQPPNAIAQPVPDSNVFDMDLGQPITHSDRVIARFVVGAITTAADPTRTLAHALDEQPQAYLDRDGDALLAFLSADLASGGVGVTDHGALTGLGDDDHPQYLTEARGDVRYSALGHAHALDDLSDVNLAGAADGQTLLRQAGSWVAHAPPAGVTDHGALTGLGDDDHPQYLTHARGDARYSALGHAHALDDLSDVNLAGAADGQTLLRQGGSWVAHAPPAGVTDHGALTGLGDDDHPQYLLVNGSRALTGDLGAGGRRITNLGAATTNGDAVRFEQAIKVNDPAGGDLAGSYPNPTVDGLLGRPLSSVAPQGTDLLTWNGSQWTPLLLQMTPFATITRIESLLYEIWFNIDVTGNDAQIASFTSGDLRVLAETNAAPFLSAIGVASLSATGERNVFSVRLQEEAPRMRFVFAVTRIRLASGETLHEFTRGQRVNFMGFDGQQTVTIFVPGPRHQ